MICVLVMDRYSICVGATTVIYVLGQILVFVSVNRALRMSG